MNARPDRSFYIMREIMGLCWRAVIWLDSEYRNFYKQLDDVFIFVESFAEYVPAPCTHRPSSHPSERFVKHTLSILNKPFARGAKNLLVEH